jgi:hypothetical protein
MTNGARGIQERQYLPIDHLRCVGVLIDLIQHRLSQTTRCSSCSAVRSRRQFSVMTDRLRSSVSVVSQARCGVTTTFCSLSRASSVH